MKTYLYVKTHNATGLKYFGKTTRDPITYRGSGKHWLRHLRTHGSDVSTEIIGVFTDVYELVKCATEFSVTNDIVNSNQWANLIIENGLDGAPVGNVVANDTKLKISAALTGRSSPKSKYTIREPADVRKKRLQQSQRDRVWITNGTSERKVKAILPIPHGWWVGRSDVANIKPPTGGNADGANTRGKKIYNNGVTHRYFDPSDVPPGFVPGKMDGFQGGTGSHRKGKRYDKKEN